MKTDRRSFLQIFGVGAAVVADGGALHATEIKDDPVAPLSPVDYSHHAFERSKYDVVKCTLYSKLVIEKNSMRDEYALFDYGYFDHPVNGQPSLEDTNMDQAFRLSAPGVFRADRIGVMFSPVTVPALSRVFSERYAVQLWIGNKRYFESPVCALATDDYAFAPKAFAELGEVPLIFDWQQHFRTQFTSARPLSVHGKITLWSVLDGYLARGVQ